MSEGSSKGTDALQPSPSAPSSPPESKALARAETDLADPAARRVTAMALAFWTSALVAHLALGRSQVAVATLVPIVGLALARALIHVDANRERVLVLALSSNVLGFFCVSALTGGMVAPTLLFLPTFAVAAGLLSPPRRALAWGVAALGLVGLLGTLERLEALPAQAAPAPLEIPIDIVGATLGALFIGLRSRRVTTALADENGRRALAAEEMARRLTEANERASELLKKRAAFLANVSHELRTPLGAIVGLTTALNEGESPPEEQRDILQTLSASTDALRKLVDDLLDHEAMDRGFVRIEKSVVHLRRLVREVASLFAAGANKKNLRLVFSVDAQVPKRVEGDPLRLRQVLSNLVSNAVKYTSVGEVVIRVGYETSEPPVYEIQVTDTGPGISAADQAMLFVPFERTESSTARRTSGSGLGLALSRQLVEAMGGTLVLQSEEGRGSTFRVRLPCAALALWEPPPTPPEGSSQPRKPRTIVDVLVVDDDPTNRKVASLLVERLGHRASTAGDGASALALAKVNHYDVTLLDYHMPDMLGTELAVQLRTHVDPVPLMVALTAAAFGDTRRACEAAGIPYFLSKPIDLNSLREILDQAGRIRRGSKSLRAVGSGPGPSVPAALTPRAEAMRVLDVEHLAEVLTLFGEPAEQRVYLDEFLGDAEAMIEGASGAFAASDQDEVGKQLHRLAGAAATVGAVHLAEAARTGERAAKTASVEREQLKRVEAALKATRAALATQLGR